MVHRLKARIAVRSTHVCKTDAIADAVVAFSHPGWEVALKNGIHVHNEVEPASADWGFQGISRGLIALVAEYKPTIAWGGGNQVIMDLATAQSQRRALALRNTPIFGFCGSLGNVELIASLWIEKVN